MESIFFKYNMIKSGKLENVKKDGIIILDTNALLNVYRYNKKNREKYFEILSSIKERLFLTYQSVKEFHNNRLTIIENKIEFKKSLLTEINEKIDDILNIVKNDNYRYKASQILRNEDELKGEIIKIINNFKETVDKEIESYTTDIKESFIFDFDDDFILDNVMELYKGKVNDPFDENELNNIYSSGKVRYEKEVPPGYKDAKKKAPDCYGDLIIWEEMIKISKNLGRDILFISDDRKEDWCEKNRGHDCGPREELIKEFFEKTGYYFYSLTTKEFIKYISECNNVKNTSDLEKQSENIMKELSYTYIDSAKAINGYLNQPEVVELGKKVVEVAKVTEPVANKYMSKLVEAAKITEPVVNKYMGKLIEAARVAEPVVNKYMNELAEAARVASEPNRYMNELSEAVRMTEPAVNRYMNELSEAVRMTEPAVNRYMNELSEASRMTESAVDRYMNELSEVSRIASEPEVNRYMDESTEIEKVTADSYANKLLDSDDKIRR